MYSRSERNNHDRGRSTLRERARRHFFGQKKEMEHELTQNRNLVRKLFNDGYQFDSVTREDNRYEVHFLHPDTQERRDCIFNFESNYNQLASEWKLAKERSRA